MDIEEYKKSMPRCKDCTGFGWGECKTAGENEVACKDFERKPKLTNADRIRQMTDEELAEFLRNVQIGALAAQFTNTGIDSEEKLRLFLAAIYEEEENDDER